MRTSSEQPTSPPRTPDFSDAAFYGYHCFTKHTAQKLYANRHFLDWANQPDPFRHYEGAPVVSLPTPIRPEPRDYFRLDQGKNSPEPMTLQTVADLLYYSMAISAWKEVPGRNIRWPLRVNPSSGNLHPTETHLIARGIRDLPDGCYHFRVDEFTLEMRYRGKVDSILGALADRCQLPASMLTVLLTSIFWREAWKYQDRAFRYCHHDIGHAVACVAEALTGLGYAAQYCHCFDDDSVSGLFGLSDTDERPGVLLCAGPPVGDLDAGRPATGPRFVGQPNQLSEQIVPYESIDQVYEATRLADAADRSAPVKLMAKTDQQIPLGSESDGGNDFWHVVRTRRSGVGFDGRSGITLGKLGTVLRRATVSIGGDVMDYHPDRGGHFFVHLFLYVHRVAGLEPGVYYYDRVDHLLNRLHAGDVRRLAKQLSLQQNIAGDSALAVSMIADLSSAYGAFGERAYRAVHLEAGYIGQGLYLGAEAIGTNATGIGAFFDDEVNQTLGLPPGFEAVYHFTIGKALPDDRVRQKKAYWFESDESPDESSGETGLAAEQR